MSVANLIALLIVLSWSKCFKQKQYKIILMNSYVVVNHCVECVFSVYRIYISVQIILKLKVLE